MWVILGDETLKLDVGVPVVNELVNSRLLDLRFFEAEEDAARHIALHNVADLDSAGGLRLWNTGEGVFAANQDDSAAGTEAGVVASLVLKNLTGGAIYAIDGELPQKMLVVTGT